jgi:hypothetical protein
MYSYDLGMSSPCYAHKPLITWFIGYWDDESFADHTLSILKYADDSFLVLFGDDTLYPPFELISENVPSFKYYRCRSIDK